MTASTNNLRNALDKNQKNRILSANSNIYINYTVTYVAQIDPYTDIDVTNSFEIFSQDLYTSVSNGNFTRFIRYFSMQLDCVALMNSFSNEIIIFENQIFQITVQPTSEATTIPIPPLVDDNTKAIILGISVAFLSLCIGCSSYFYYYKNKKGKKSAFEKWTKQANSEQVNINIFFNYL